ncbi:MULTISPECIES: hypothetical protein [Streptosporangium]|uniref:Uncharacterized protein n=1 Tax=Streptosporangium brasiliense TaxID=47480 RepID=A0ABT9RGY5_9ACTN|nr:hypothetical protein [Streptosporangium brasiliense]MDP9867979.1 hypothetical protein [Streptosporangium brasiliense]
MTVSELGRGFGVKDASLYSRVANAHELRVRATPARAAHRDGSQSGCAGTRLGRPVAGAEEPRGARLRGARRVRWCGP